MIFLTTMISTFTFVQHDSLELLVDNFLSFFDEVSLLYSNIYIYIVIFFQVV